MTRTTKSPRAERADGAEFEISGLPRDLPPVSASRPSVSFPRNAAETLSKWAAAIAAAATVAWLSRGTSFHQLALGALTTVALLFVILTLWGVIWRWLGVALGAETPPNGGV